MLLSPQKIRTLSTTNDVVACFYFFYVLLGYSKNIKQMHASIVSYAAGACSCFCLYPQAVKAYQSKKTDDLSPVTFFLLLVAMVLWMVYGILTCTWALVAENAISIPTVVFLNMSIYCSQNGRNKDVGPA